MPVSVTLPPLQKVVAPPADIVGVDGPATRVVVIAGDDAVHPAAFVTVTVYVELMKDVII